MIVTQAAVESGSPAQADRTPGRGLLSEDWAAVVIGAAVIAVMLGVFAWWKVVDLRQYVPSGLLLPLDG
jgi:hypothetical protein